jgi:hypothetical protein
MDKESWENLQFLLVYKIRFNADENTPGHKMYKLYKQWIAFETEVNKRYDEELKKLKSDLKRKRVS